MNTRPSRRPDGRSFLTDAAIATIASNESDGDTDVSSLVELRDRRRISVVLPAHNEAATVGQIVGRLRAALQVATPLIEEIVVMDDRSCDDTARRARLAGATVHATNDVLAHHGPSRGKGDAIWRSLDVTTGEILVFCDADLEDFDPTIVTRLVGPLLMDPSVALVKGYFRREGADGRVAGGRVTELSARPLLEVLAPHLAHIREPLGGMFATTRSVLEQIPIESDYGVDLAILADVADLAGTDSIRQVDLGILIHRHRELHELANTARQVVRSILDRFGETTVGAPGCRPLGPGSRRPPHRSAMTRASRAMNLAPATAGSASIRRSA